MSLIQLIDPTATTAVEVRPGITVRIKTLRNSHKMVLVHDLEQIGNDLRGDNYDAYMKRIGDCIESIEGAESEIEAAGGIGEFLCLVQDFGLQGDITKAVMDLCTIKKAAEKN